MRLVLILISFLMISTNCDANVITYDFLSSGLGVRAAGMGSAFTAVADDADAIFYNPAGIAAIRNFSVLSASGQSFGSLKKVHTSLVLPFAGGSLGLGYVGLSVENIIESDDAGNRTGSFSYGDSGYFASYAVRTIYSPLSCGVSARYITKKCGTTSVSGLGYSVSALVDYELVKLGLTVNDLFDTQIGNDKYAQTCRTGFCVKPLSNVCVSIDYSGNNLYYGLELKPFSNFAIRAGYEYESLTVGCSLNMGNIIINTAYKTHGLGDSLVVEVGI